MPCFWCCSNCWCKEGSLGVRKLLRAEETYANSQRCVFLMNKYQCVVTLFNKTSLSTDECKTNPFFH